jgi:hypothetical protein
MPSTKDVIAFRVSDDEAELINRIATDLGIPKSRVIALALRVFRDSVEKEKQSGADTLEAVLNVARAKS